MIYEGRGFLIDWDLAQRSHLLNQGKPRMPDHTGTWQFISTARLLDPANTPHLAVDDMESVFWVFLYLAHKCGNHGLTGQAVGIFLTDTFDHKRSQDGILIGGSIKQGIIMANNPDYAIKTVFTTPQALNDILQHMRFALSVRYEKPVPQVFSLNTFDEAGRKEAEKDRQKSAQKHADEMKRLEDPVYLRQLLKYYTSDPAFDWSGDCPAISREIPRPLDQASGLSASKRSYSNRGHRSTGTSFEGARPSDSITVSRDVIDDDDDDDDDDKPKRSYKKQRRAYSATTSVAASHVGGGRFQLVGADSDELGIRPRVDDEDSDAEDVAWREAVANLQAAANGAGDNDIQLPDVEMRESSSEGVSSGLESSYSRSQTSSPLPPSSPSSAGNNYGDRHQDEDEDEDEDEEDEIEIEIGPSGRHSQST